MTTGPELFGRYAFPPNALGYCGPADSELTKGIATIDVSRELARVVQQFDGAWPYLELIGGCTGLDPLDRRVVEAYWIGNDLLDGLDALTWGNSVDDRFRARAGGNWESVESGIGDGVPNHAFHVFCVYPWVGLLRSGHADHALNVLDRCRIRWGTVESVAGSRTSVRSRPLTWDGEILGLGEPVVEVVSDIVGRQQHNPGSVVSLHWDYICDAIDGRQLGHLQRQTSAHLEIVNRSRRHLERVIER